MKRLAYLAEISLPKHNSANEYYFLDVFEHLILIMIIRREIINYAIKTRHYELLGVVDEKMLNGFDDLIYQLRHQKNAKNGSEQEEKMEIIIREEGSIKV